MTSTTAKPREVQNWMAEVELGPGRRGGAAVAEHDQRRRLVVGADVVGVGRRVEEGVGEAVAGGGEPDRLGRREPLGVDAEVAGGRSDADLGLDGAVGPDVDGHVEDGDDGLGGGRGADEHGPVAEGPQRRQRGERRAHRHDRSPAGGHDAEVVEAVPGEGHEDAAVAEHGVARLVEDPVGHADLGLDRRRPATARAPAGRTGGDGGVDRGGVEPVEVPPVGAVGEEEQVAVGGPLRLGDRSSRLPATTTDGPREMTALAVGGGVELGDVQLGAVPRHVGVVPLEPGEVAAVGADPRARPRSRGR